MPLVTGFALLTAIMALLLIRAVRHVAPQSGAKVAGGLIAWLAASAGLAGFGLLGFNPPTILALLAASMLGATLFARSSVGSALAEGLPLWVLVGFQVFRVPVGLLLHGAWEAGLAPRQMTWAGWNFDVISGGTAALLGAWLFLGQPSLRWVRAWNLLGIALLLNVVTIAVLSMPTPLRVFYSEPGNEWILNWPYNWLPAFLAPLALFGHLILFKRMRSKARRPRSENIA